MWRDIWKQAFVSLIRRPARSALTVLGLMIGVASFIAMVAFGDGARKSVLAQFESLGSHAIYLRTRVGSTGVTGRPASALTEEDVVNLRRDIPGLRRLAPTMKKILDVRSDQATWRVAVFGSNLDFFRMREWSTAYGGLLVEADEQRRAPVCVLGMTTAQKLFGDAELAIGAPLRVGDRLHCNVVGVLSQKGSNFSGSDQDDLVVVPIRTFTAAYGFAEGYNNIDIQPAKEVSLQTTRETLIKTIRRSHRLNDNDSDDFGIYSPDDVIRVADQTSSLLGNLLAGVAMISMLVGGIGIMNILLVSVGERTQEIGIRSAIGAPPNAILVQFLAEALVLSLVGSLAGATLGGLAAFFVAGKMGWVQSVTVPLVITGISFGVAVGVVFGILPARRASTLDPIVALRRE